MEAHSPPSKVARVADNGVEMGGGGGGSIGLDLGLGPKNDHQGKSSFTFFQLQELEHQALIYKYMAAGIPVPSHLVLPIWKSLGSTYAGTGIYPSFLGSRGVCYDYRNNMEPEPGRCRRTDGKKWRCAKDVVPDQKYCERHMHRGRNRSRKHVEATNTATTTATTANTNPADSQTITIASLPNNFISVSGSTDSNNSASYVSHRTKGLSPKSVLHEDSMCKAES